MAIPIDALIEQMRKEAELTGDAAPSEIPAIEPKNVVPSLLKRKAALEKQRESVISQQEEIQRQALEKLQAPAPAAMPMGVPQLPSFALGEKPLPRTYEALQAADKRLEELSKKMALPKEEPNLLAEALLAGIPTILGAGIGAAIGKPGLTGAGLAAGATGGAEAIKGMKAAEKETRAAQQKAAEEKLQRQTTLEKSYLDAVAKAENYPYEAALIVAKSASPEFSKQALEQMRANLGVLQGQAKDKSTENKLKGIDNELTRIQQQLYPSLLPPKPTGGVKAGKVLTAEQAKGLADIQASETQLKDIAAAIEKNKEIMGPVVGRLKTFSPYETGSKTFDAQMKVAAQVIGKSLEGGKLTDADLLRYRQMLPSIADTPEVASGKLENIRTLLAQKRAADLQVFQQSGYDVSKFAPTVMPQAQKAAAPTGKPDFSKMSDAELKKYLGK